MMYGYYKQNKTIKINQILFVEKIIYNMDS